CLNAEVIMRTEYCLSERKRLKSECESQADLLKDKDVEIESLKSQPLPKEAEAAEAIRLRNNVVLENERDSFNGKITKLQSSISAKDLERKDVNVVASSVKSQNDGLVDQVHALETTYSGLRAQVSGYERLKEQIEEFQDTQLNIVNDKVAKLDADLLEMALHLEEKFYPHLLTTISSRRSEKIIREEPSGQQILGKHQNHPKESHSTHSITEQKLGGESQHSTLESPSKDLA
nr:hypothetical protein [Tanacetum cinerariifolium]